MRTLIKSAAAAAAAIPITIVSAMPAAAAHRAMDPAMEGYVWYSYDSTGKPITVTTTGVGHYQVHLGAFAEHVSHDWWARGTLRVTPYGTSAVYCQILDPQVQPDPAVLQVICFGPDGYAVNSRFVLTYAQGVEPVSATVDNYGVAPFVWAWSSPSGVKPTVVEYTPSYPGAVLNAGFFT